MNTTQKRCFACDRLLGRRPAVVDTLEDQRVYIGRECYKKVLNAGKLGYQPPKGGPKLYPLTPERHRYFFDKLGLV